MLFDANINMIASFLNMYDILVWLIFFMKMITHSNQ